MSPPSQGPSRSYHAPRREAAAARTRASVVAAAKTCFERHGWSGSTLRLIADTGGVSQKTVEALFGTKAALLRAAVEYAIRGDVDPVEMPQREPVARMEVAPTAAAMLALHAKHLRTINERSARIAAVVEAASTGDNSVAELWARMNHNRRVGVRWAADTLLTKPGRRAGLSRQEVDAVFWVALDWGTFRTLTDHAGLDPEGYEAWLRRYYRALLLPAGARRP
jgi:AcrR family transcriptional regulator